jgi:hypothetical protein
MVRMIAHRSLLVLGGASACCGLSEPCGGWPAFALWASAVTAACVLGAVLLRTSTVGQVTWKNRLAGCLLPWGWRLNAGRLWVAAVSWLVWASLGGAVTVLREGEGHAGVRLGLLAAWIIDVGALAFALGSVRQATPGGRVGVLWVLVAVIAALLGVRVGLYAAGLPLAALVAGGGRRWRSGFASAWSCCSS